MPPLILASGSEIRANLLRRANVEFQVCPVRLDEEAIRISLANEGATPRDVADALAESKARKAADRHHGALVVGCDQVLEFDGKLGSKPRDREDAIDQLRQMAGTKHSLFSAAVLYEDGQPVWRHVGEVRLWMREASDLWLRDYVQRNWESIRHTVGCYKLEEEGIRLFTRIEGDYFNVLGIPLLELLSYLTLKGNLSA